MIKKITIIKIANIRFCLWHLGISKFFPLCSGFILGLFSTLIKVTACWPHGEVGGLH